MKMSFARERITPLRPMCLAGYDARKELSSGTLDDIYVSLLTLEDAEGRRFLLLSFDLLGVPRRFCGELKRILRKETGVPEDYIWLCATHTHAAPRAVITRPNEDEDYISLVCKAALKAAQEALSSLQSAKAYLGVGSAGGVASLRDKERENSLYAMPLMRLRLESEGAATEVIGFQCHPTVLNEKNLLVSRDLVGAAEGALPKDNNYIFLNGACGDLSTRYTRLGEGTDELKRLGNIMARAIESIDLKPLDGFGERIKALSAELIPKPAQRLNEIEKQALIDAHERRIGELTDEAAKRESRSIIAVLKRPPKPETYIEPVTVSAVDFGSFILIGMPFEINSADGLKMSLEISARARKPAFIACYTGGYDGYLPSGKAIDEHSSYQDVASKFAPSVRQEALNAAIMLTDKLKEEKQ